MDTSLNIVDLIENNTILKLSPDYNNRFLQRVKECRNKRIAYSMRIVQGEFFPLRVLFLICLIVFGFPTLLLIMFMMPSN